MPLCVTRWRPRSWCKARKLIRRKGAIADQTPALAGSSLRIPLRLDASSPFSVAMKSFSSASVRVRGGISLLLGRASLARPVARQRRSSKALATTTGRRHEAGADGSPCEFRGQNSFMLLGSSTGARLPEGRGKDKNSPAVRDFGIRHPPPAARSGGARVSDLPGQGRQLRQGGVEAVILEPRVRLRRAVNRSGLLHVPKRLIRCRV